MKTLIKIVFGTLVVAFALIIAAVVVLPLVVSPNDYKPQIIQAVKQQTGRDLSIEGDIGLNVFPKIGLQLGRTELSNAAGFSGKTFARVNAVNIQVALMPLLEKKVEMDEVVLDGLVLNLHRKASGAANWDDLGGKPKGAKKAAKTPADGAFQLAGLVIGGIRIEGANVNWQDDANQQKVNISNFNLVTGALSEGKPVDMQLSTEFNSSNPAVEGKLRFDGTAQANLAGNAFSLSGMNMVLEAKGKMLPGGRANVSVKADRADVNLKEQVMSMSGLQLAAMGATVSGEISGNSILSDKLAVNGKLVVAPFNARELLKVLGQQAPVTADPGALTRVNASFDLVAGKSRASLNNLKAGLDDTSLSGKLAVTDFSSQAVTFDLAVDKIDLDRYLPPPEKGKKGAGEAQAGPVTGSGDEPLFPVDTLRTLNASGQAKIGELRKSNLTVNDIVVTLKARGGNINIRPVARLYGGNYQSDVTIDARPAPLKLDVNATLDGVQIEPLLKDLQGKARLAGTTRAKIDITARGNSQNAVKKTLNGNADFAFENGALIGVNIAKILRDAMAALQGKRATSSNEPEKTDFSELKGTAKITNGLVDNRDFAMKSPLLRITGAGTANLVTEQLDYLLRTSVVGSLQGQGGADLSQLKGVTIPVKVTGSFDQPSYKPDLSAVVSDKVKQKVDEKVEERKQEVKDKLKDKFKDKLKGLF